MVVTRQFRDFLGALPADEWFGRQALLAELGRRLRQAPQRSPQSILLHGPAGAGVSELLRQAAALWSDGTAELTPIYFDLARLRERADRPGATLPAADPALWSDLLLDALAQWLYAAGRIDAGTVAIPRLQTLQAHCSDGPWRGLADLAAPARAERSTPSGDLDAFLMHARELDLPRPVIVLDGLAQLSVDEARAWLLPIARAVRRAGASFLLESPADAEAAGVWSLDAVEPLALAPLAGDEALALAQLMARRRGVALDPDCCLPILERLGPWPGWLRAWVGQMSGDSPGIHPRRLAEQSYVALLTTSGWSRDLGRRFETAVPLAMREGALHLIHRAVGRREPLTADEALVRLAAPAAEVDRTLRALVKLNLLEPVGPRWRGPSEDALVDWVALAIDPATLLGDLPAARMELLTRLLERPRPALPAAGPHAATRLIPEVLTRFDGQVLPDVLFRFYDYYEAVGRLDPMRRREAIAKASQMLEVPEVIGVAAEPFRTADQPALFQARAFAGGKFLRIHEELWVAVDYSAARALTTPEIEQAIERSQRLRLQGGLTAGRLWLIVGETVSAEALELLRREKILCSNLEQLAQLREMLIEKPRRMSAEPAEPGAIPPASPPATPAEPPLRTVIDLQRGSALPRAETTTLRLPAREDSEYIAALMAEKVAIRADFTQAEAGKIKTSVLEGVLNAIEHSPNPEKLIDIQFRLNPQALEVLIENEGPAFDPLEVSQPDPRAKLVAGNKRGWGITLMRKFMDEVEYEPHGHGTRLRLLKRRAPTGQPAADRQGKAQL